MRSFLPKWYSGDQTKNNEMDEGVGRKGKRMIVYRNCVRKHEVKRKLVKPRHRWEMILK
jgi:hypothetical protein